MNTLMHIDPLDSAAALPRVVHRTVGERFRRFRYVDILTDVDGILAPELELALHHSRRAGSGDPRAGLVRAGEEHTVDRLRNERTARGSGAGNDLEDIARHSGFLHHL